jgi:hypothetical protein
MRIPISRRRRLVWTAGAAVISAALALAGLLRVRAGSLSSTSLPTDPRAGAPDTSDAQERARLGRELDRAQQRALELERIVADLGQRKPEGKDRGRADVPGPASPGPYALPSTAPSREDELAHIQAVFAREADDPAWDPESDLHDKLEGILPAGSTLRSLECRSSMCRLDMTHVDMESYQEFATDFLLAHTRPLWPGPSLFDLSSAPDKGEVIVVGYLGRDALPSLAN